MYVLECGYYTSIIDWAPSGLAFVVMDKDGLEKTVLPELFKEAKYSSFERKLKRWGFIKAKVSRGTKTACFGNPLFQKGDYSLCSKILCGKKNNGRAMPFKFPSTTGAATAATSTSTRLTACGDAVSPSSPPAGAARSSSTTNSAPVLSPAVYHNKYSQHPQQHPHHHQQPAFHTAERTAAGIATNFSLLNDDSPSILAAAAARITSSRSSPTFGAPPQQPSSLLALLNQSPSPATVHNYPSSYPAFLCATLLSSATRTSFSEDGKTSAMFPQQQSTNFLYVNRQPTPSPLPATVHNPSSISTFYKEP